MNLNIGFSPCPNDTFIFDALVHKKIDTEGLSFDVFMEDIETLNRWSSEKKLDITKLSFPAFFQNLDGYIALPSGAALGKGVGPLLVTKSHSSFHRSDNGEITIKPDAKVAIPGFQTTANFLFSFSFPAAVNRFPVLFSDIEDVVLNAEADFGLLIHENRFTYQKKGLVKAADLGELWEKKTGLPIPLACIAIKKSWPTDIQKKVGRIIKKSLQYAFDRYPTIAPFVKEHAQAMDEDVMKKHIDLYVNNFSLDLGEEGKNAIRKLYAVAVKNNNEANPLFV